jgi:hypothetical protein
MRSNRPEERTQRQATRQENRTERQGTRQEQTTQRQGQRQEALAKASGDYDYRHWDSYWGAAAVGAAAGYIAGATLTASAFAALPCTHTTVVVGGVTYYQCGSTWYQPAYAANGVTYVIVNPPSG